MYLVKIFALFLQHQLLVMQKLVYSKSQKYL